MFIAWIQLNAQVHDENIFFLKKNGFCIGCLRPQFKLKAIIFITMDTSMHGENLKLDLDYKPETMFDRLCFYRLFCNYLFWIKMIKSTLCSANPT